MKIIPLGQPTIGREEISNVIRVLKSGWLTHGEYNERLEDLIKKYFKVKDCVLVNSCASALLASLVALDLPESSEVIVPSFTFVASANAIVLAGLTPVFAEVDINTGNIDPNLLKQYLTKKTKAIMPVHFAGQPADMTAVMKFARENKLKVVEDSAECIGGKWRGKYAGTFGDLGCFSFWATKNLTTGEGGAIITNNRKLAEKLKAIIAHGVPTSTLDREQMKKPWMREAVSPGYNFRLSNLAAAVGVAQFRKLDKFNKKRLQLAKYFTKKLSSQEKVVPLTIAADAESVFQMFPVKVKDFDRTRLIQKLQQVGIQASVHFDPPVHRQQYNRQYARTELPQTDLLSETEVTLPFYPNMTKKEIDYIVETIKKIIA